MGKTGGGRWEFMLKAGGFGAMGLAVPRSLCFTTWLTMTQSSSSSSGPPGGSDIATDAAAISRLFLSSSSLAFLAFSLVCLSEYICLRRLQYRLTRFVTHVARPFSFLSGRALGSTPCEIRVSSFTMGFQLPKPCLSTPRKRAKS